MREGRWERPPVHALEPGEGPGTGSEPHLVGHPAHHVQRQEFTRVQSPVFVLAHTRPLITQRSVIIQPAPGADIVRRVRTHIRDVKHRGASVFAQEAALNSWMPPRVHRGVAVAAVQHEERGPGFIVARALHRHGVAEKVVRRACSRCVQRGRLIWRFVVLLLRAVFPPLALPLGLRLRLAQLALNTWIQREDAYRVVLVALRDVIVVGVRRRVDHRGRRHESQRRDLRMSEPHETPERPYVRAHAAGSRDEQVPVAVAAQPEQRAAQPAARVGVERRQEARAELTGGPHAMFQREPAESLGAPEQVLALGSPVAREEQRRRDSIGVRADDEDARRIAGPSGTRARHPRALPLTGSSSFHRQQPPLFSQPEPAASSPSSKRGSTQTRRAEVDVTRERHDGRLLRAILRGTSHPEPRSRVTTSIAPRTEPSSTRPPVPRIRLFSRPALESSHRLTRPSSPFRSVAGAQRAVRARVPRV